MAATKKKKTTTKAGKARRQAVFTVLHSGAGVLTKTKTGVELRLCSSAAEVRAAGGSSKLAAQLFPKGKKLCDLKFYYWASPIDEIFGDYPLRVRCVDTGCKDTSGPQRDCKCVLYSTAEPGTGRRQERNGRKVEEGRWYKCFCECTFFG